MCEAYSRLGGRLNCIVTARLLQTCSDDVHGDSSIQLHGGGWQGSRGGRAQGRAQGQQVQQVYAVVWVGLLREAGVRKEKSRAREA